MKRLLEIREALTGDATSLESILLKCKVLAAELRSQRLRAWVDQELDGYPPSVPLVEYRKVQGHCFGDLATAGAIIRNEPIPLGRMTGKAPGKYDLRQGIRVLEKLSTGSVGYVRIPFSPDDIATLSDKFYARQGAKLVSAEIRIPTTEIERILGAIRSNLLGFILDIQTASEDIDGNAGDNVLPEKVDDLFAKNIPIAES